MTSGQKLIFCYIQFNHKMSDQKTLTRGGSNSVQLVYSLTGLDSMALLHENNNIFSFSEEYKPVKLVQTS